MSNVNRILTIRVKIIDAEKAIWIWESMRGHTEHGVEVSAARDGDMFAERRMLQEQVEWLVDNVSSQALDTLQDDLDRGNSYKPGPWSDDLKALLRG